MDRTSETVVTMSYSKYYYEELDSQAQERYKDKCTMAGLSTDPYLSKDFVSGGSNQQELWPDIEYPDICNYLIYTTSSYTKEHLKAYKSMDGYNFFVQGWVGKVEVLLQNEVAVLRANVRHSQSISSPLLHPWVAAKKDGTILCAHCTCMAGLGEACSHVAALLFCAEANTQARNNASTTSGPNQWIRPTIRRVEYASIADINFKKKRRVELTSTCSTHAAGDSTPMLQLAVTSSPTEDELSKFYSMQSFTKWH